MLFIRYILYKQKNSDTLIIIKEGFNIINIDNLKNVIAQTAGYRL